MLCGTETTQRFVRSGGQGNSQEKLPNKLGTKCKLYIKPKLCYNQLN